MLRSADVSRAPRIPLALVALAGLVASSSVSASPVADAPETLTFARDGVAVKTLSKAELRAACGELTVEVDDAYYREPRRYRACPLGAVLREGFGSADAVAGEDVQLRALDGYTRAVVGDQLLERGAFLAFEDADRAAAGQGGFDPIDRRQVDPAPFYLVWQGEGRDDPTLWPWPFQLATIDVTPFARRFPHVVPPGVAAGSPEVRGFELFRRSCIACHAINGEGGKVGPDLNVPRSIVDYRPEAQIKAFVRDPASFRYTTMPPHPNFSDADLEDLVTYLRHMSRHRHDPGGPVH